MVFLTYEWRGKVGRLGAVVGMDILGWRYRSVASTVKGRLGARAATPIDCTLGGNSPQMVVGELARRIRAGRLGSALVTGAEAIRSRRRARREVLQQSGLHNGRPWMSGTAMPIRCFWHTPRRWTLRSGAHGGANKDLLAHFIGYVVRSLRVIEVKLSHLVLREWTRTDAPEHRDLTARFIDRAVAIEALGQR